MTINEMRANRAAHWESMKNFLEKHRQPNGTLTAEDDNTYRSMEAELDNQTRAIEREERAARTEEMLNAPANTPIVGRPDNGATGTGIASEAYRKAFFADGMRRGFMNALQVGTDSEGGYLVPTEFETTLITALNDYSGIRSICRRVKTSGKHAIPVVTTKTVVAWMAEEAVLTNNVTDPAFGQKVLDAHKLGGLIKISKELLADEAVNIEAFMRDEFARAIAEKEEDGFVNGNGSGKPTGFLDGTYGGAVGVTGASATAIAADELLDLFYALKAPYRKKASWVMNDATVKAVRKLKDNENQYMWVPGLRAGESDTLLGKPLVTSAAMPTIASAAKTMAFGDFSFYWIGDRQGMEMQRLNELYAANGQVGFLSTQRVDGLLTVSEAVQIYKQATAQVGG